MQYKKGKLIVLLLLGISLSILNAQEVVPVTGGNATGSGGTANYTVGQIVYTTNSGTNGTSSQGVQQPFEISVVTMVEEARDISLEIVAYPNPATDFVRLKIENYEVDNLRYQLYDINGTLLISNNIEGIETDISLQAFKPSTYFLKVIQLNKEIKIFKIIKK